MPADFQCVEALSQAMKTLSGKILWLGDDPGILMTSLDSNVEVIFFDQDAAGAAELPFPSRHCDAVVCHLKLHLVSDPRRFLHESFRILKPGGILLVTTLQMNFESNPQENLRITGGGISLLIQQCGFLQTRVIPTGNIYTTCAQALTHALLQRSSWPRKTLAKLISRTSRLLSSLDSHPSASAFTSHWLATALRPKGVPGNT
jgi:ubiquinone/menaquinone biosynthesis C-methylase UbiE